MVQFVSLNMSISSVCHATPYLSFLETVSSSVQWQITAYWAHQGSSFKKATRCSKLSNPSIYSILQKSMLWYTFIVPKVCLLISKIWRNTSGSATNFEFHNHCEITAANQDHDRVLYADQFSHNNVVAVLPGKASTKC